MMNYPIPLLAFAILLSGCPGQPKSSNNESEPDSALAPDGDVEVPGAADTGVDLDEERVDMTSHTDVSSSSLAGATSLMTRLGGLWVGPANQTPLGQFPIMPLDFRAADPNVLFARVDLDENNALRMAFFVEDIGGETHFVFRNGGLFMGLSRDTKTVLHSHDIDQETWRFCHPDQGCEYVDAIISFDGADDVTMDVKVRGEQHMLWAAQRQETRTLPDPFPESLDPIGTGDAPFPPMPTLTVELSWQDPSTEGAWVWVVLSDTPCGLTGRDCQASRAFGTALDEGATSVTLQIEQLHAADYRLNAILDRDGSFQSAPFPNSGDAIVFPVDPTVNVPAEGATTSHSISLDVP